VQKARIEKITDKDYGPEAIFVTNSNVDELNDCSTSLQVTVEQAAELIIASVDQDSSRNGL